MEEKGDYVLYLDETGDHTITPSQDIGKRYLGLCGPVLSHAEDTALICAVDAFRRKHLSCDERLPILDRKEIMQCRGVFSCLQDPGRRTSFDSDLLAYLSGAATAC